MQEGLELLVDGGRIGVSTFGPFDDQWREQVDATLATFRPPDSRDARTTGGQGPFASDEGMEGLLAEAGSGLDRVVQVTMLISDRADYAACNAEYVKHFPGGLPARHTVLFGVPTEARVGFACVALAD